jgi:AbrB family looped-hinge helix DNA binding protein
MSTATVTSKGQITIPADVRQAFQVKAGDRVEFVQIEPGLFDPRHEQGDCGPRGIGSMIGLATNGLVRYIMQDDAKQSAKANKLIESLSADKLRFIPLIAIVPTR